MPKKMTTKTTKLGLVLGTMATGALGADTRTTPGTLPAADVVRDMNAIIDASFATVPNDDGYRFPQATVQPSWEKCSIIDYTLQNCFETTGTYICDTSTPAVQHHLQVLGIDACFSTEGTEVSRGGYAAAGSAGCKALFAFLYAHGKLTTTYPMGPAFANSEMVSWTNATEDALAFGEYPSWRAGGVTVNNDVIPPRGTWNDLGPTWGTGNSVNGYAICDIVTTILQQTNNQAGTSTCGPSAILAALNFNNPIKSLKYALELLWTGGNRALPKPTCEYIVDNQPGLIAVPKKCDVIDKDNCPAFKACIDAKGNENDCKLLGYGIPLNPVGIQSMSTQAWQSSYFSSVDGAECTEKSLGMNYEGGDLKAVRQAQMSSPALEMYLCKYLLNGGQDCVFEFNANKVVELPASSAKQWVQFPGLTGSDIGQLQDCLEGPAALETCVADKEKHNPRINTFIQGIQKDATDPTQGKQAVQSVFGSIQPSFTSASLEQACHKPGEAVFFVKAAYIQSNGDKQPHVFPNQPPLAENDNRMTPAAIAYPNFEGNDGNCDHWIVLESCNDDDTYTFWTWGYKVRMSKVYLLGDTVSTSVPTGGMICGAVHTPLSSGSGSDGGLSGGHIAAIVLGSIAGVALLALAGFGIHKTCQPAEVGYGAVDAESVVVIQKSADATVPLV